MKSEFMTIDTPLPPCMPLPAGMEDTNGILFIRFPIMELSADLSRSPMTVKRALNELENAGLVMRVRQGVGETNHLYILLPKEEADYE